MSHARLYFLTFWAKSTNRHNPSGVDMKMTPRGPVVTEVNELPILTPAVKTGSPGGLYRTILRELVRRLDQAHGGGARAAAGDAGRLPAPPAP